jgi:acetone carboxylase gamma subunit
MAQARVTYLNVPALANDLFTGRATPQHVWHDWCDQTRLMLAECGDALTLEDDGDDKVIRSPCGWSFRNPPRFSFRVAL